MRRWQATCAGALGLLLAGCDLSGADDPARAVLDRANRARRTARPCGDTRFEATTALGWNPRLASAAARHSHDLAATGRSSHLGSDGSTPLTRITDTGYAPGTFGEAVAVGSADLDAVMKGWLQSPGHCRVLMGPRVTEAGAAVAGARYWTLDVAAPAP